MEHKGTKEIETQRLVLRKIKLKDAKNLTELLLDKDVQEFLAGIPSNYTIDMAINYINNVLKPKYKEKDYYDWAVVEKDSNKLIGRIGLFKQDDTRKMADLVWYLNKNFRCKGYTTEAVKEVVKFLQSVGFKRIEAFANIENKASQKVMEKCGFSYEGTLRKYDLTREGDLYDANMFSITTD